MQGDGVGHDGRDLGDETGHGRHHEAGRALAVDDGLNGVGTGGGDDRLDRPGMVVHGRLVEGPFARREIDAGPPVFQPHVPAVGDQVVDQGRFHRRLEDVGPYPGAMYQQDRASNRRCLADHVNDVAWAAVIGREGKDVLGVLLHRVNRPFSHSDVQSNAPHKATPTAEHMAPRTFLWLFSRIRRYRPPPVRPVRQPAGAPAARGGHSRTDACPPISLTRRHVCDMLNLEEFVPSTSRDHGTRTGGWWGAWQQRSTT